MGYIILLSLSESVVVPSAQTLDQVGLSGFLTNEVLLPMDPEIARGTAGGISCPEGYFPILAVVWFPEGYEPVPWCAAPPSPPHATTTTYSCRKSPARPSAVPL